MSDEDWNTGYTKCIGIRLAGDMIDDENERGESIAGDTILVLLNAHHETLPFTLPLTKADQQWERLFDTADDSAATTIFAARDVYPLMDRSLAALRTRAVDEGAGISISRTEDLIQSARRSVATGPPLDV